MSEIKVDKISPQSGTALQIGDASDVITIPASATITNLGTATGFGADTSLSNLSATGENKVAQVWINFNGTGTIAIRDSYGVSSITDRATGEYTVTFSSAMANANYAVGGSSGISTESNSGCLMMPYTIATGSVEISVIYQHAAHYDREIVCVLIFGD